MDYLHKDLTNKIIKSYYKVYNELGFGFLEKVYENALFIEMQKIGLVCQKQYPIKVFYQNNRSWKLFCGYNCCRFNCL